MKLTFEVDTNYLFYSSLIKGVEIAGWVNLQNELWDKYKNAYQFLQKNYVEYFIKPTTITLDKNLHQEISELVTAGKSSEIFKKLTEDTISYKEWLENNWINNKDRVIDHLNDILRIDLNSLKIKVLVVGNKTHVGRHISNGVIAWGHPEDWQNYSLVYLMHESLHDIFGKRELEHAVIELITDNELRLRLNGSGEYFYENNKLVGHDHLLSLEKDILTAWKAYLADYSVNIFDFIKKLEQ